MTARSCCSAVMYASRLRWSRRLNRAAALGQRGSFVSSSRPITIGASSLALARNTVRICGCRARLHTVEELADSGPPVDRRIGALRGQRRSPSPIGSPPKRLLLLRVLSGDGAGQRIDPAHLETGGLWQGASKPSGVRFARGIAGSLLALGRRHGQKTPDLRRCWWQVQDSNLRRR
jgi:hypothetical protein